MEIYISNLVKEEAMFNIKIKKPAASPFLSTFIRHTTILSTIHSANTENITLLRFKNDY